MGQYGLLPETDLFLVVVCDQCKAAVKPQGLQKHIHRHNTSTSSSSDVNSLASLITPCSVSVNPLKFDPKAENSNSSTSSGAYNIAGGSFEASSSSSSNHGLPDSSSTSSTTTPSFQDFMAVAVTPQSNSKNGGSLKIKLSKQAIKASMGPASSTATRPVSESPTFSAGLRASSIGGSDSEKSNQSSTATSGEAAAPVPGKKLGLKEREYDPNKHCGVILIDTGKHCTRTLTCKSHALSLRRQVSGRSADFDKLLADHRALRAAQLANGGKASYSATGPLQTPAVHLPPPSPTNDSHTQKRTNAELASNEVDGERFGVEAPPNKRPHLERPVSRIRGQDSPDLLGVEGVKIKEEPVDPDTVLRAEESPVPFRTESPREGRNQFEVKPFHENTFEVHGSGQLVAASNGGYFIKSEPQLAADEPLESNERLRTPSADDAKLKGPNIITVPLTMLGNVVYVNGRGCLLDGAASGEEKSYSSSSHGDFVDGNNREQKRYFTLSAGHQRATNRLRLNVIKTELSLDTSGRSNGANEADHKSLNACAEFPGIGNENIINTNCPGANLKRSFTLTDTWYAQIPKPTYINCFKLCKLGSSSAVLSKRYLNIRKSLIMNIASSGQPLHHHHHHHHQTAGSPMSAAVLNRSNSQTGSPGAGSCLDKVNFERIKV